MDANATTANQIEGAFHEVISRIALVVVHDASSKCHAIIVISSARSAKLLVDFHVHFVVLVIARSANHLESFVKAIGQEHSAINILLEVGSDGSSCLAGNNHAISKAAATKQVEFLVAIVKGNGSRRSGLQSVEGGSAAYSEGGAALGDHRTCSSVDRANAHNHVLALHQFCGMVKHEKILSDGKND